MSVLSLPLVAPTVLLCKLLVRDVRVSYPYDDDASMQSVRCGLRADICVFAVFCSQGFDPDMESWT